MATATENSASQYSEAENPKKTLTLTTPNLPDLTDDSNNSSTKSDLEPLNGAADASLEGAVDNKEADESKGMGTQDTHSTGNSNDIQKKLRRAERFGVPVQLSEQEKRNSRAERFCMGGGSESSKTNEEQKRKARAERFGLSVSADEEGKKKARLSRFGSDTKIDTLEEEKRKARALRFAQKPPSNDVPHINGKEDDVSNTAIAGNTSFDQSRVAIGVSGSVLSSCNRQLGVNAESKYLRWVLSSIELQLCLIILGLWPAIWIVIIFLKFS